jgi:hypothetical protein
LISARPTLRPTRPLSPASPLAAPSPGGRKHPAGPSSPRVGRVFAGNTFSFQITPSRAGRLLPVSPPHGPHLSASSSLPRRPTPVGIFPVLLPRALDAPELLQLSLITPSMALKPLTPALTAPATPPRCSPSPYKRRAPSPEFTASLPAHISLSPRLSNSLIEHRCLPALHRHRQSSSTPLEPR